MNEKVKIVVLNSGGLDSVVLMHYLRENFPEAEMHSLFFDYGQNALEPEKAASQKVANKVNSFWKEIKIEPFNWSESALLDGNNIVGSYNSLYLEMRNMIFVSYATSYAQSIGAAKVYAAIIKPPEENPYPDATEEFVNRISSVMNLCGIELCTPLIQYEKHNIFQLARKYNIGLHDFCSCFKTEKFETDKCSNCELVEEYSDYFDDTYKLEDTYFRTNGDEAETQKQRLKGVITHAKISINDACNLNCSYCLMTGVSHTDIPTMTPKETILKLYSFGIRTFDIFGKEPLFSDNALKLINSFNECEDIHFTMITNGKNLKKYSDDILKCDKLESLTVSYDGGFYRTFTVEDDTLTHLINNGFPVSISIDLHNKNWIALNRFLNKFYDLGISSVYVKPIEDWGGCDKRFSISENLYDSIIKEVVSSSFNIPLTTFAIPYKHKRLTEKYSELFKFDVPQYCDRPVRFFTEPVCLSGYDTVFVNYDGRVYGCGNCAYERPKTGVPLKDMTCYSDLKAAVTKFSGRNCCNPIDNESV